MPDGTISFGRLNSDRYAVHGNVLNFVVAGQVQRIVRVTQNGWFNRRTVTWRAIPDDMRHRPMDGFATRYAAGRWLFDNFQQPAAVSAAAS